LVCGADCWEEVVGVVADTRIDGLDQPPPMAAYSAWRQAVPDSVTVAVRTGGETPALGEAIRHVVAELDPELPIDRLRSMEEIVAGSVAARRLPTTLLGAFAALALLLAAVGVAGVIAYLVAARRRELGIRLALGATRGSVVALVVGQGVRLLLAGGLLGLLAATALGRFLAGSLYGVSPRDPLAFGGAAAALALAALVGSLIPARRAGRVEPMAALRGE
ncbi:MAG TPA: FtsX-like permease family protein, partial [Thermoanaerobaculia bacterium]|nr:FtsX-like permease family protein [Thermoanaerobaculia bacterium]